MKETFVLKKGDITQKWYVVDAAGKTLGRLATKLATVLRGKHKPTFAPNLDNGDYVVVINAEKVVLTGDKLQKKFYHRHSGYPGGLKSYSYEKLMASKPAFVIEQAVKGMLGKGPLGRKQHSKLKVYAGAEHPHAANKPEVLEV